MLSTFWQDVRFAFRTFIKRPGFALVAIVTLALGIGANSAIFSVINGVLLKPLPFHEPENVIKLWESMAGGFQGTVSPPNLKDWREQNTVFTKIAAFQYQNFGLQSQDAPERVRAATVSPEFFDVLGVQPQLGRVISDGEDQQGKHRVAVLSHQLWQDKFASDPAIAGKTISLGGENYTVVGVMPASFRYPSRTTELWVPLVITPQQSAERGSHWLMTVARLKPGVSLEQANEQMNLIAKRIEQQYPGQLGRGVLLIRAQEEMVRNIRPALLMLLVAVGFVLLISCTNVANLLLARATTRRREIAIRLAMGAGRGRLIRQLLTESALLSLLGGAVGLMIAYWGITGLVKLATGILPRANEVSLDGRVVGFTIALSLLTGIVFGLAPALQTSRADLQHDLKEGSAAAGNQRTWLRSLLVIGEIAAALILLVGASLLIKSFARLQQTESGVKTENVLTAGITLPDAKYDTVKSIAQFHKQMLERVSALPGVQSAGIISKLPMQEWGFNGSIQIEGQAPTRPGTRDSFVEFRAVSPGYFATLGIPLVAGRMLDDRDQETTSPSIVVNQTLVRQYLPGQDAIGKPVVIDNAKYQIVGVVGDVRQSGLAQNARAEIYWPYTQSPDASLTQTVSLAVRAAGNPTALTSSVRDAVLSVDPGQPIHNVKTMEEVISDSVSDSRLNVLLLSLFAAVALTLALIGVYSVMSYLVAQSTREIGIRIALGAQMRDVLRLVVSQGMLLIAIGVAIGIVLAFALTRLMESLLYGVTATDPLTFVVSPLIIAAVALIACLIPALRATKVDPMIALRYE